MDYRNVDREIWEDELEDFVPERVFDAHCHLVSLNHLPSDTPGLERITEVYLSTLNEWASRVYPERETHFLMLAKPRPQIDVSGHNRMLGEEAAKDPLSRVHGLATPSMKVKELEEAVKTNAFQGLKVYRTFSVTGDIKNCRIHEYFPLEQMALADELGLWVTLHLSRSDGPADEYNLKDLKEYTRRFPGIRWILAHCARGFTPFPLTKAINRLKEMPNIWYDLSAVTDVRPFITLFKEEDHRRLFYGSDGIDACSFHGKYIVLGKAWQTFYADESGLEFPHCDGRPILSLYEQLLSMKHAAEITGLDRDQLKDIFWRNANEAFGLGWG